MVCVGIVGCRRGHHSLVAWIYNPGNRNPDCEVVFNLLNDLVNLRDLYYLVHPVVLVLHWIYLMHLTWCKTSCLCTIHIGLLTKTEMFKLTADVMIFFPCSPLYIIVPLHLSSLSLNFHLFHMHSLTVHT